MTDIEVCSWPGTTVSMPMNSGRCLSALKYSTSWYWNCWIDCHRHMLRFGLVPDTSPCGITPEFSQVVFGIDCPAGGAPGTNGYSGRGQAGVLDQLAVAVAVAAVAGLYEPVEAAGVPARCRSPC